MRVAGLITGVLYVQFDGGIVVSDLAFLGEHALLDFVTTDSILPVHSCGGVGGLGDSRSAMPSSWRNIGLSCEFDSQIEADTTRRN